MKTKKKRETTTVDESTECRDTPLFLSHTKIIAILL